MDRKAGGSSPSPRERPPALYVITRKDLADLTSPQVIHAAVGWVMEYGAPPESVVVLAVPDEPALWKVLERLNDQRRYAFNEPDLDDTLTAIAVGPEARKLLSSLPLLKWAKKDR